MDEKLKKFYEKKMSVVAMGLDYEERKAVSEMARRGLWTPEWIAAEFEKVEQKISRESARIREVVRLVGMLASYAFIHDHSDEEEKL